MCSNSPIPIIFPKWRWFRDDCVVGWQTPYVRRIEAFDASFSKQTDLGNEVIINLIDP